MNFIKIELIFFMSIDIHNHFTDFHAGFTFSIYQNIFLIQWGTYNITFSLINFKNIEECKKEKKKIFLCFCYRLK